jgi:hypothetical protein
MSTVTLRLPEDKHARLKALARQQGVSLNRLIDEATSLMIAEYDAEMRFQIRAARGAGKTERGLALLAKARGAV